MQNNVNWLFFKRRYFIKRLNVLNENLLIQLFINCNRLLCSLLCFLLPVIDNLADSIQFKAQAKGARSNESSRG